jgi:hypothetical protein
MNYFYPSTDNSKKKTQVAGNENHLPWCLHVSAACVIWLVENKNDSKFKHEYTNDKMAFIGTSWPKN